MVWIVFNHPSTHDRFKDIIKGYIFLGHFLLRMLRDTYILHCGLRPYPSKYRSEIIRIMHHAKLRPGADG